MSPRKHRRRPDGRDAGVDSSGPLEMIESWPDGDWAVRPVAGAAAGAGAGAKTYRCPGCDQEIRPGIGHVVAWPAHQLGSFGGPGDRRHWHTACWRNRARRGAVVQRSRNAPRYG